MKVEIETSVEGLLKSLNLELDQNLVFSDGLPLPLDEGLKIGDEVTILKIVTGG